MPPLSHHARSPHSPSPIYGISPGFTVGDLDRAYTPAIPALYMAPLSTTSAGPWDPGTIVTQLTTSSTSGAISANARAVKIQVNVSGTGSIVVSVTTAADGYTTPIAIYNNLTVGSYMFYLGGYGNPTQFSSPTGEEQTDLPSDVGNPNIETFQTGINAPGTTASPTSDGSSYIGGLSQYGPIGPLTGNQGSNPSSSFPGGFDPARANPSGLNPAQDNNFFGQTYNPFQFLSLDGYQLKLSAVVTGTVGYDASIIPIS